jgi:hypothetical protein
MNMRFLWSLVFALTVPFAQVAAAAHEMSHVKATPASIHCDQCSLAAAVSGGAATSTALAVVATDAQDSVAVAPSTPLRPGERFTAFSSRAPPSLP